MNIITIDYSMATASLDIFVSGCNASPRCKDCHNPESWDFSCGTYWREWIPKIRQAYNDNEGMIKNIFLLGGEPLDQDLVHLKKLIVFLQVVCKFKKPIWLFTRYELNEVPDRIKKEVIYIKCGRYIPELLTNDNVQHGVRLATSNQNIYKRGIDF